MLLVSTEMVNNWFFKTPFTLQETNTENLLTQIHFGGLHHETAQSVQWIPKKYHMNVTDNFKRWSWFRKISNYQTIITFFFSFLTKNNDRKRHEKGRNLFHENSETADCWKTGVVHRGVLPTYHYQHFPRKFEIGFVLLTS